MTSRKQFCTFFLGEQMFGIDVLKIQEVIRHQETTDVPLAPGVVRGLLNLRGSIVSTIDLRRRFGMPDFDDAAAPINVVTQTATGLASLLVDRIGDVVEVDSKDFEYAPDTLQGEARNLIEGVYKLDGSLLLILNVERVMELDSVLV